MWLALLVTPAALLGGAAGSGASVAQASGTLDATAATVLVALLTIAEAAGSALAPRVPAASVRGQAALGACGALLVAVGWLVPGSFHAVVAGLAFVQGMAEPLRDAAIQREAADGGRARAASVAGAFDMAVSVVAVPVAGFLAQAGSFGRGR